jgi:hypothetical protein
LKIINGYFYGCYEYANDGSSHIHILSWLANSPNPNEFVEKIKIDLFKNMK